MNTKMYTDGDYLAKNPTWHVQDSLWKATKILEMIKRNDMDPATICEIGCGAGEILQQLQVRMSKECTFWGYEISPQAFSLAKPKENERLHFLLDDILEQHAINFDLILLIDIIEHLEDYFSFLRRVKPISQYKMLHIPLELSAQYILRTDRLMKPWHAIGHIHFFTKETALQSLKYVGYDIVDCFYTAGTIDLKAQSIKSLLARLPRKILFAISPNFAVRILGGFSLMVLVK
jgi:hypothetical protein